MRIPVISMYGPWANWVGMGWKTIETRTHPRLFSLVGKRIGIHCALKWDDKAVETARPYLQDWQIAQTQQFLRIGGCVAWMALVMEGRKMETADEQAALIECTTPRWGLILREVQAIEMIPMRGHQGIWYANVPS